MSVSATARSSKQPPCRPSCDRLGARPRGLSPPAQGGADRRDHREPGRRRHEPDAEHEAEVDAEASPPEDERRARSRRPTRTDAPEEEERARGRAGAGAGGARGGGHPPGHARHPPERQRLPAARPVRALARRRVRLARPDPPLRAARGRRDHRPGAPAAALGALPVARARGDASTARRRSRPRSGRASRISRRCSPPSACRARGARRRRRSARARAWRSAARPARAPPRCCAEIVGALLEHQPELELTVVLAGVRPEEVTEWRRDSGVTVAGGAFDRSVEEQAQVAEMAVERAKRAVEHGRRRGRGHRLARLAAPVGRAARVRRGAQHRGGRLADGRRHDRRGREPQRVATTRIVLDQPRGRRARRVRHARAASCSASGCA